MSEKTININIPVLARVEGEGALDLRIANNEIEHLRLRIFEPPRFFEKLLEAKHYSDVPDIVARICGICPVAYQMSAVSAFESLFALDPGEWVHRMRRLFYCGEWIESHALHIHLLAAPDFLGFENAADMSLHFPEQVKRGLRLQHAGNQILQFLGGRAVHPVGVKVGGFFHAPNLVQAKQLLGALQACLDDVQDLLVWLLFLDLLGEASDFIQVAFKSEHSYDFIGRHLHTNLGFDCSIEDFATHFKETHETHSTALYSLLNSSDYLVGPLARLNLNHHLLPQPVKQLIQTYGFQLPNQNMFNSIIARGIELYFALAEAINILQNYEHTQYPSVNVKVKAGQAFGCSEAPRGILWHSYEIDDDGYVRHARIVPPTSQNQARMQADLQQGLTQFGLDRPENELRLHAEQIIRNYDPCISCATHFLNLNLARV